MKTYKLIIELSDSMLDKMASIEEVLKESSPGIAIAQFITFSALKEKLEEEGSVIVNMDAVVNDKELCVIKHAVVSVGAVAAIQGARNKDKKEQE